MPSQTAYLCAFAIPVQLDAPGAKKDAGNEFNHSGFDSPGLLRSSSISEELNPMALSFRRSHLTVSR